MSESGVSSIKLGTPDFIQHNRLISSPFMRLKPLPFTGMSSNTLGEIQLPIQADDASKSVVQRNRAKKLPHLPE
jgi:hypothetical protein